MRTFVLIYIYIFVCRCVYMCVYVHMLLRTSFFHLGSQSPIKLSRAFVMGPNTCTCYYITVTPLLFSPPSILSCFLSSFSQSFSLSDCFGLQLSPPISFCLTLSCQAHNFISVCLCVGLGKKKISTVVTLQ